MRAHMSISIRGYRRNVSANALIGTGVDATIFDADFVEQMPWVKRVKSLRLEGAYQSETWE